MDIAISLCFSESFRKENEMDSCDSYERSLTYKIVLKKTDTYYSFSSKQ